MKMRYGNCPPESGGQRDRLAISRGVVPKPKLNGRCTPHPPPILRWAAPSPVGRGNALSAYPSLVSQPTQLQLVDLSRAGFGKGVTKLDSLWNFVIDKALPAVRDEIVSRYIASRLQHNERDRDFSPKRIL